jgi:hypothetical protein
MKHTDNHDDPAAQALAGVAGLARQVEPLSRDVAAMKKGLKLTASAAEVARLAQVVTDLGETLAKSPPRQRSEPDAVPSWLVLPYDAKDAQTVLADVLGWLRDVYLRYADARNGLTQCWLWHPEVVEELLWLMYAWMAAYRGDGASVKAAGDWHDRLRPGVVKRIREYTKGCDFTRHKITSATPAAEVPSAEAADAIVAWWSKTRDQHGPAPTPEQIAAARAALTTTETGEL